MSLQCRFLPMLALAFLVGGEHASAAPANDSPFAPVVIDGCAAVVTGTTIGSANDVDMLNCGNDGSGSGSAQPYGGDVFYRVTIPSSYSMHVLVEPLGDWDLSVYVFTSSFNPDQTCVTGADIAGSGFAESLRIDNFHLSGEPREFMIAVDSWRSDVAGDFRLSLTCDFVVSTDSPSFSTLKSRFHGGDR
jgi:hypothetical protein